ncbi:transcriptional regulator family: Fungal Specific TF [Penicillium roqueforti]|uniref:transcriptional regulator family: Fungal Specific TF n=1 Tax=Penicillium roqueforti TaxID=5082 RepID=UPI00190BEF22|nr:transcriptional regulator family: Fungal Specific TF [Penicillium roqueforti]KAF9250751.1 transcriptional regulator family: Fungal Specific TF [Penicillium roqueforti]KAI2716127.1 transcriptional regulator family: Fungal Specific TF [Penicillium roqueforti]KAI2759442.1 transcriptional regulator family: Fungal Specific TF [Penicillium roqueforti]KAI3175534.1 transcriptional regulator family: Fungal Specific TF [Penicillium roqueforti]KAI3202255.1 transcriptional regulator family: Fungal Spec
MAPVTLKTVDDDLKDVIQHLFEIQSAVHGYLGPETQQELVRKIKNLTLALSTLSTHTQLSPTQETQPDTNTDPSNPSLASIQLPPEIIDYVDSARNPDIYTREFVELVQRGNQDLRGKREAFASFRDVLAREMRSAMPECRSEVDRVVAATGGTVDGSGGVAEDAAIDASHPEIPENDRRNTSLYHGPTSTVYDDTSPNYNEQNRLGPSNEEGTRHFLFSQTARQRQLEPLNLAAGRLDFDGIDPDIGMHLLSIYWSRQLYTAQIIYRPAFMRDMACEGPYFSKLLLNAIFFVVSKHCDRPELRSDPNDITTAGWKFRQRFTQLLRDCFDKSEITTLQALLIMSNALFSRCDERSLSWLYAGNAFNMFIDLGLHVLPAVDSIPAEELEIRKRVLWGAYFIDKIQCLFQGRPPLLNRVNVSASLDFLDDFDELEPFQGITYMTTKPRVVVPSLNVSLLTNLCELTTIVERILREIYSESRESNLVHRANISREIKSQLRNWRENLPRRLDYLSFPDQAVLLPQSACLLALFNVLIILLHRPLITGHDGVINSTTAHESVNACTAAANQIVQILHDYSQHFSLSSAPYMLSYATYISATIHARIVAQKGSNSTMFQSLVFCRNILIEHTRLYSAAEKARENLDKLISHLGINVADDNQRAGSAGNNFPSEHMVMPESINVARESGVADRPLEFGSFQMSLELSDLDLEAIAQGFQVDVESNSFWNALV